MPCPGGGSGGSQVAANASLGRAAIVRQCALRQRCVASRQVPHDRVDQRSRRRGIGILDQHHDSFGIHRYAAPLERRRHSIAVDRVLRRDRPVVIRRSRYSPRSTRSRLSAGCRRSSHRPARSGHPWLRKSDPLHRVPSAVVIECRARQIIRRVQVLIVDDSADAAASLTMLLELEDIAAQSVGDAEAALQFVRSLRTTAAAHRHRFAGNERLRARAPPAAECHT